MAKSGYAKSVDDIQAALRPTLKAHGFRVRGRTFNRTSEDGLTHVINLQMGPSDPPGTTYIPGLRENLHGLFTVNLGVYVPEVAKHHGGGEARSWVQEYHCCVRARLAEACGATRDIWWPAQAEAAVIQDVRHRIEEYGLPFIERYATRDRILVEWRDRAANQGAGSPPRIAKAIILLGRGEQSEARKLLTQQLSETTNPRHPDYIRSLAERLGLGRLDG